MIGREWFIYVIQNLKNYKDINSDIAGMFKMNQLVNLWWIEKKKLAS